MAESPDGIGNDEEARSWKAERGITAVGNASCASGHDRADHRRLGA